MSIFKYRDMAIRATAPLERPWRQASLKKINNPLELYSFLKQFVHDIRLRCVLKKCICVNSECLVSRFLSGDLIEHLVQVDGFDHSCEVFGELPRWFQEKILSDFEIYLIGHDVTETEYLDAILSDGMDGYVRAIGEIVDKENWKMEVCSFWNFVMSKSSLYYHSFLEVKAQVMEDYFPFSTISNLNQTLTTTTQAMTNLSETAVNSSYFINHLDIMSREVIEMIKDMLQRFIGNLPDQNLFDTAAFVYDFIMAVVNRTYYSIPSLLYRLFRILGIIDNLWSQLLQKILHYFNFAELTPHAQSKEDSPIGIVSSLVAIIGTLLLSRLPDEKMIRRISDLIRVVPPMTNTVSHMLVLLDQLLAAVPVVCKEWMCFIVPERYIIKLLESRDMQEWVSEVWEYKDSTTWNSIVGDWDKIRQVQRLMLKGQQVLQQVSVRAIKIPHSERIIMECMKILNGVQETLSMANQGSLFRATPFVVCLEGKPGVGKSHLMSVIAAALAPPGTPRSQILYCIQAVNQRPDGYRGHKIVGFDDWGATTRLEDLELFLKMVSPAALVLEQARLEDKGMFFDSEAIILTTNTAYPSNNEILHDNAVWRRRDLVFRVELDDHWIGTSGVIRAEDLEDKGPFYFKHLKFTLLPSVPGDFDPIGPFGFETMMYMIHSKFRQNRLIAKIARISLDSVRDLVESPPLLIDDPTILAILGYPQSIQKVDLLSVMNLMDAGIRADFSDEEWKNYEIVAMRDPRMKCSMQNCLQRKYEVPPEVMAQGLLSSWIDLTAEKIEHSQRKLEAVSRRIKEQTKVMMDLSESSWNNLVKITSFVTGLASSVALVLSMRRLWVGIENQSDRLNKIESVIRPVTQIGSSGDARTMKATRFEKVVAHACEDVQAVSLIDSRGRGDLCWLTNLEMREGKTFSLNAFAIQGRLFLTVLHVFKDPITKEWVKQGTRFRLLSQDGSNVVFAFDRAKVFVITTSLGEKDACIFDAGPRMRSFHSNVHHFISEEKVGNFQNLDGCIIKYYKHDSGVLSFDNTHVNLSRSDVVDYNYRFGSDPVGEPMRFKLAYGWQYPGNFSDGNCGGVIIGFNPHLCGKMLGIHVCGGKFPAFGYGELITREMLEEAIKHFDTQILNTPFKSVESDPNAQGVVEVQTPLVYIGRVPPRLVPGHSKKTTLRPSIIHDLVWKHTTEPAVFTRNDPRLEIEVDPMELGVNKYAKITMPFDPDIVSLIKEAMMDMIFVLPREQKPRVLSEFESINGVEGMEYIRKIEMDTSPGYPYVKSRPAGIKGKSYLFHMEENGEWYVSDPMLRKNLDLRFELACEGRRMHSVWIDNLKDERREISKVLKGDTRVFTCGPVDFQLIGRRMFGAFENSWLSGTGHNFFSFISMNPFSDQWEKHLWNYLRQVSDVGFAGDYKKFDGTLSPDFIWIFVEIINQWYKEYDDQWKPSDDMVRKVLIDECIHTIQLARNSLYLTNQGNPSGNFMTIILNTFVNMCYLMFAWIKVAPSHLRNFVSFRQWVRVACVGDDNIVSVEREISTFYNLQSVS